MWASLNPNIKKSRAMAHYRIRVMWISVNLLTLKKKQLTPYITTTETFKKVLRKSELIVCPGFALHVRD